MQSVMAAERCAARRPSATPCPPPSDFDAPGSGHSTSWLSRLSHPIGRQPGNWSLATRMTRSGLETRQWLKISDPLYGEIDTLYSTFLWNCRGSGTWTHSYITKS